MKARFWPHFNDLGDGDGDGDGDFEKNRVKYDDDDDEEDDEDDNDEDVMMMMVVMVMVMVVLFMGVKDMRGCQIWTMMSMTMPILLVCHLHKGKFQTMNNPIILIPRSSIHLFFICPLISQSE